MTEAKKPLRNRLNNLDAKAWLKFQKSWFIHNPPPRRRDVLTHPAKFPETLAQEFIEFFTKKGQTVLDPMMGTGSALVAALRAGRNAVGIELNPKYFRIAERILNEERAALGKAAQKLNLVLHNADAGDAARLNLPTIDYVLTSPPYWDMLHARGAETQKKRRATAGLDVVYSDDPRDLGNVRDYDEFIERLAQIYEALQPALKPKAYLTIIVKNVKKGGKIYPLAWDLARRLGRTYALKDEKIWCLPPGQGVWTQYGLRNIETILEGDLVLTHHGSLQKVSRTMSREHSGAVVRIKPSLLGKEITVTPEHEILVIQRKEYIHKNGERFRENSSRSLGRGAIWLPARELRVGDLVAFPIPTATVDLLELDVSAYMPQVMNWHQDEASYYTHGRGKFGRGVLPKRIPINRDFMRLAGWFLSEGSVSTAGVYIANTSSEVRNEISRLFISIFNIQSKIDKRGVWCRSRSIAKLLAELFGKGAHSKRIPEFMLYLPIEKQRYLLQALWEGDGHVRENRVAYKTVSEPLATGIVFLSARVGAMPSYQRNPEWISLNYRGNSMRVMQGILGKEISFPAEFKRDRHWIHENKIWLPIRELTYDTYNGKVYNLEVEDANTYVTEGFIVHNCQDNQRLAPYGLGNAWVSNTFHHYCLQFRNEG